MASHITILRLVSGLDTRAINVSDKERIKLDNALAKNKKIQLEILPYISLTIFKDLFSSFYLSGERATSYCTSEPP